jgi:hypothetical protein
LDRVLALDSRQLARSDLSCSTAKRLVQLWGLRDQHGGVESELLDPHGRRRVGRDSHLCGCRALSRLVVPPRSLATAQPLGTRCLFDAARGGRCCLVPFRLWRSAPLDKPRPIQSNRADRNLALHGICSVGLVATERVSSLPALDGRCCWHLRSSRPPGFSTSCCADIVRRCPSLLRSLAGAPDPSRVSAAAQSSCRPSTCRGPRTAT